MNKKVLFGVVFLFFLSALFFSSVKYSRVSSQTSVVTLGSWRETTAFIDNSHVSHPLPSFARGNYYYVHTMDTNGGDRKLYYAQKQVDGSLSNWQIASSDHGGGPHGFTAVVVNGIPYHFRNGHIARYEFNSDGTMNGEVVLQEQSVDTSFGGHRYVWDSAVYAQLSASSYTIHLGGFDFVPHDYSTNIYRSAVPIGNAFTATGKTNPNGHPGKSAFFHPNGASYGFIYTIPCEGSTVSRALLSSDGTVGDWISIGDIPTGTGNGRGEMFVISSTLFAIRGSKLFKAAIDSETGNLSSWTLGPDLPENQIDVTWGNGCLEGASYGIVGNYVYVTGPKKVYFAQINGGDDITPTLSPTPTGQPCLPQKKAGDYDCNGSIGSADFDAWKTDFLQNKTTLSFFEYWRRVAY